jgi:SAM-dependent methyltransferase
MTRVGADDSERTQGPWRLLAHPLFYEAVQHAVGARRWLTAFVRDAVKPGGGDKVLDIGCGPGALLGELPESTTYVGLDRNPSYIAFARRKYGSRGSFIQDDVSNFARHGLADFDVAVAIGLLHHIDDAAASHLLETIRFILRPGGRFVTADPTYFVGQNRLIRFVMSKDRGRHVRDVEHYRRLIVRQFTDLSVSVDSRLVPFPRSVCVTASVCC